MLIILYCSLCLNIFFDVVGNYLDQNSLDKPSELFSKLKAAEVKISKAINAVHEVPLIREAPSSREHIQKKKRPAETKGIVSTVVKMAIGRTIT